MCQKRWEYNKVLEIKTIPTENLIIGSVYHQLLQANFIHKINTGEDFTDEEYQEEFAHLWKFKLEEEEDIKWVKMDANKARAVCLSIVSEYMYRVAEFVEPKEVEFEFERPIGDTKIIGRIDLIDKSGAVIDHKTSTRSYTQNDIDKDIQASAYAFGLGHPITYYNHIAIKKNKPEIQSLKTYRNEEDIIWWYRLASDVIAEMNTGIAVPNPTGWWCSPDYCDYWDICRADLAKKIF